MMHNPVMFVVEIGFVIALLLSIFPELFGPTDGINNVRLYNIFVCVILFVTSSSPTSPRRWPRAAARPRPRA